MKAKLLWIGLIFSVLTASTAFAQQNQTGTFRVRLADQSTHLYATASPGAVRGKHVPLVIACHGAGGTAENFIRLWSDLAANRNFIVVAPKSPGQTWGYSDAPVMEAAVAWALETYPRIDRDRILLTGFSAGGHNTMILGMKLAKTFSALAAVAGFQIEPTYVKDGAHLPVMMLVGENDGANVHSYHKTSKVLKDAGFDITGDIYPGLGHRYPQGGSARIYEWFLGHAAKVKLTRRLDRAESLARDEKHPLALLRAEDVADAHISGCTAEEALALRKILKQAKTAADRIWKAWRKAVDDPIMAELAKARRQSRPSAAARKYRDFIKAHPGTDAAAYARSRLESILSAPKEGLKIADDLAGKKCADLFKQAKRDLDEDRKEDAVKAFRQIISTYPHTSHAKKSRQTLRKMGVPVEPEAECTIPKNHQIALKNAAVGAQRRNPTALRQLGAVLKLIFKKGHTEDEVNQVLREVGLRYDRKLGQLFRLKHR